MKCWRRLRRTWIERGFVFALIAASAACASAQPRDDGAAPATPPANATPNATPPPNATPAAANDAAPTPLERFLSDVDTLTADFEQRLYSPAGNLIERSAGTMALDRPGRFRWHYSPPDEFLLLADGEQLKTYEFDLEHLTISSLEDAAATPFSLLSGDGDFDEVFDLVDRYSADGLDWIKLEPVGGTANITWLSIGFDGEVPRRIEFVDSTDELARIDLTNVVVDAALPADVFDFELPEGATVLGGN